MRVALQSCLLAIFLVCLVGSAVIGSVTGHTAPGFDLFTQVRHGTMLALASVWLTFSLAIGRWSPLPVAEAWFCALIAAVWTVWWPVLDDLGYRAAGIPQSTIDHDGLWQGLLPWYATWYGQWCVTIGFGVVSGILLYRRLLEGIEYWE
ncbi:hypothetical protein JJL56_28165 [Azospirillum sp. YIM DDC1]|uniref:Uncharacterized protein n=1 Tax=Azospirillum aestuarii TaxID=2802052 RepID=A0ABS1I6R6_9PROT|nr:hypothetical protein [Azospirillum aestuarii]MBK4722737.1 hypothetical protein [Azospirillum aestuarii]